MSEVAPRRVVEVARHRQLEEPGGVGRGVALAETALPQPPSGLLQFRGQRARIEAALELVPRRPPGGGGRDQGQARDPVRMLRGVEQRQQPAPGVSGEGQLLEPPPLAQRLEVGDVLPPSDRHVPRPPANDRRRAGRSRPARRRTASASKPGSR